MDPQSATKHIFTALHALHATRSSHEKVVCPSVCPSVKRVDCEKMKESSAPILIPHERTFILVLPTRRTVGGGDSLYLKFWVKLTPLERKRRFPIDIRL